MKKLKIVLAVLAGLFVVITAVGFLLPSKMTVNRSVIVAAPPSAVYPLIANFKTGWSQWNPFDDDAPDMKYEFSGPDEGVGAAQAWDSKDTGDGKMTITRADPAYGVDVDLTLMQESFRLKGALLCEPAAGGTKVTWTDEMELGGNPYRRYMGRFLESAIGSEFEKGLNTLREKAEAKVATATPAPAP
jgi:hypothetical protein